MAQSFYPTALRVITQAFTDIGAIDPEGGVTPSTSQLDAGLESLNFLVTSWQAHGMQVWCQRTWAFNLVDGVNTYTVGDGGSSDISILRPLKVNQAWITDTAATPDVDIPMRIISREEYNRFSVKYAEGLPNCLYYDPAYSVPDGNDGTAAEGVFFIYPTPDATIAANYDISFVYTRPIQDFLTTGDTLDFPQEWANAVRWNLAYQLCPQYEVPLGKWREIKALAKETLDLALSNDTDFASMYVSPAQQ